ncbi:sensor histidine kinase [Microbacterium proteolyticum]|uniref:sensor histidine kinase n=1 Tax=Microbacterium proteolyticum TaxID=1572644 RepID=UPI0035BFD1D9
MTTASVLPPPPSTLPAPPGAVSRPGVRISTPGRVAGAIAQLAALGVVGPAVFGALFGLFGAGVGLLFALLIGAVLLAGLVYALFGVAWFEQARLDGLYGFDLPALRVRRSPKPGFVGVLHTIWLQAIDPRQWRAVASFTVSTVLGLVTLMLIGSVSWGLVLLVDPLFGWGDTRLFGLVALDGIGAPLVGALIVVVATGAVIGLGLLQGVLARAILVPSREAQLEEQARTSDTRRAGAVRAAEVERTRIERDLHDGVQPRLVSIGMTLGLAQTKIDDDPEAAKALVAEAHASTKSAITELRQLARGIHASVLEDRGLDAALSALASRSHIPVTLDVRLPRRCSRPAEAAVYFSIAEALTNAAKHSRAGSCRVDVRVRDDGSLWARVEDDGLGGARVVPGGGLDGIMNRVTAAGGTVRIDSPQGGPTSVEVTVPCAS